MDERMRQFVILRTLGAANGLIIKSLAFEFLVLGAMAGLVAALGAEVSVFYLETRCSNYSTPCRQSFGCWVLSWERL